MPLEVRAYTLVKSDSAMRLHQTTQLLPALAPHQVRVKIGAASLNYRDLLTLGNAGGDTRDGLVPLSDAAGTVVAIGAGVTHWKAGDRVAPNFFASWHGGPFRKAHLPSALGGGQTDGVLSEQIVCAERALVAVPEHLTLAQAATLPCAAVTAWHALFARGNLRAGDTVLIQGTGGVALFALQLAVAQGARAIVLSSSNEKLERAKALGAWQTVNYREQPAWDEAVLRMTDGEGASHVLELGGPDTFERSIAAVAAGGRISQIGVLTGFGPTPNLLPIQFLNASVDGICVGSTAHFSDLNRFLAAHRIEPVIDREFAFDEAPAAFRHLHSAQHFGKIVINVDAGSAA